MDWVGLDWVILCNTFCGLDWIGLDWVRWRKIGLIEWLASGLMRARLQKELSEKKQRIDPFADLRDRALSGLTTVITSVEEELASYKSLRLSSAVSPLPF